MRRQSQKAKEIQQLIESGLDQIDVRAKGYNRQTVRYYWRKIKNPKQYRKFVKQIQGYNEALLTKKKKCSLSKKSLGK